MDKIEKYRNAIKKILEYHDDRDQDDSYQQKMEEYETQIVVDDTNGHYFVMGIGWNKYKRIHGMTIHIDLKGDKIWIQQDWTDYGVANDLHEMGVPKEDIVLAFHAPYKRPYTGYAIS